MHKEIQMTSLLKVSGVGPAMAAALAEKGITTAEILASSSLTS
jgi:predicted flap endonuclease-1-like 5' DNA nuclease